MASSKEDGAAAAAEQLGSMSLGESAGRRDDAAPTTKNGTNPTKMCSACDKKSKTLKKCNGCKCVWYCDKKCQNKHRKEHKKECRPIKNILDQRGGKLDVGTELDVGPLLDLPPKEDCPICMCAFPIHPMLQSYATCCGKTVCASCILQHQMKSGEQQTCPYCRTAVPKSDEEVLVRLRKRAELKDPDALCDMALNFGFGKCGLPVDQAKCVDLLHESADRGYPLTVQTRNLLQKRQNGSCTGQKKCDRVLCESCRRRQLNCGAQSWVCREEGWRICCCNASLAMVCIRGVQGVHPRSYFTL